MPTVGLILFILFSHLTLFAEPLKTDCQSALKAQKEEATSDVIDVASSISQQSRAAAEQILKDSNATGKSKKGYAVLIGAMIGSAALSTFLSTNLPDELQFTSFFISQVSTLGVYILGAPIWEPMSSRFRKWAFGVSKEVTIETPTSQQLELAWTRTQESYSLNAQMSRNLINQFLLNVKQNFYSAYRAHTENNPDYAADQVAEAAYRMRILFRDISPKDPSVATAINSAFTNHLMIDSKFIDQVWERIKFYDVEASIDENLFYYQSVLSSWFTSVHGIKIMGQSFDGFPLVDSE